jgi:hypothetical protein
MNSKALRHGFQLLVVGIFGLSTFAFAQQNLSHVRVVRLSYVSGTVALKRPTSTEWAKAQVNTPIQEGFEISTSAQSYAEVEFENGSTARLGELSKLNFDQLAMDEQGNKLNRITFEQGYATFHLLPEHHDAYSVKIAETTLTPNGKTEFRTDLDRDKARVEVFSGSVEAATPNQKTAKLGKEKVLEFDTASQQMAMNETQGIAKDAWDKWTSQRDTQTQLSFNDQAVAPTGPLYGWGDLNAYGEWGYFPGFGYGWSPFVAAGWSPYTMGMWNWYPGMGYTWMSGEPWGWLPYHYGNWDFSPGFGWFWMPGNMGAFSPALVSWYSGPGWIGWAPQGALGVAGQSIVTTVPGGVVQNGLAVNPETVNHLPVTAGTRIRTLPFEPGAGALLSGTPLSGGTAALFTPRAGAVHSSAPSSILMGGAGEKELALEGGHSSHEPLRARMGTTLGGLYAVGGGVGEFRGDAFGGVKGQKGVGGPQFSRNAGGPTLLPHGQQAAFARQGGPTSGGQAGGGQSSVSSSPSMAVSSSSAGHAASAGPSSSSSGGHH